MLAFKKFELFEFTHSPASCSLDANLALFIAALDFLFLLYCFFFSLVSHLTLPPLTFSMQPTHQQTRLASVFPDVLASVTSFTQSPCVQDLRVGCLLLLKFYPSSRIQQFICYFFHEASCLFFFFFSFLYLEGIYPWLLWAFPSLLGPWLHWDVVLGVFGGMTRPKDQGQELCLDYISSPPRT